MADYYYNWTAAVGAKASRLNDLFDASGNLICRSSGTKTNTAYSFHGDADTGIYRIGANNLGIACGDTKIVDIITTGMSIVGTLGVSGAITGNLTGNVTGNVTGDVTGNVSGSSGSCTGNSATVTTNANLTGDVTSVGNATSIASGVIVNADINASAAIVDTKLDTISTGGKVSGTAITSGNISTSGNFTTSGTIKGAAYQASNGDAGVTLGGPTAITNLGTIMIRNGLITGVNL